MSNSIINYNPLVSKAKARNLLIFNFIREQSSTECSEGVGIVVLKAE